jgi:hypothetical protein
VASVVDAELRDRDVHTLCGVLVYIPGVEAVTILMTIRAVGVARGRDEFVAPVLPIVIEARVASYDAVTIGVREAAIVRVIYVLQEHLAQVMTSQARRDIARIRSGSLYIIAFFEVLAHV